MTIDDLIDRLDDEALALEPRELMDQACVGVATRPDGMAVLAYSVPLCVLALIESGMSTDAAIEWMATNIESAWVGPGTPVFLDHPGIEIRRLS